MSKRRLRAGFYGLFAPILLLIIWQIAYSSGLFSPTLLPRADKVFKALFRLFAEGHIWPDIAMSFVRMATGLTLAAIVGVTLGLAMGAFRPIFYITMPAVDFVRSVPVTTLYPIFVLGLGISHASKIAMVFTSTVFVIAINSAYGVFQSNKIRRQMAFLYGGSKVQVFRWVVFYDALPQTMIGLRVALSYALIVEILCEMFMGSQLGLGQRVIEAFTTYSTEDLYALVLVTGALGFILNRIFAWTESKLIPWSGK